MGRRNRRALEIKPFCYYCDREFDDEKVLHIHQKQKHFKCLICSRKLDTAGGLAIHMLQVHKEPLAKVPQANPGFDNPEFVIHGMDGVPEYLIANKRSAIREKAGQRDLQKQQRIHWTTIAQAPTLEQLFAHIRMGLPTMTVPGLGTVPTLPGGLPTLMFDNILPAQVKAAPVESKGPSTPGVESQPTGPISFGIGDSTASVENSKRDLDGHDTQRALAVGPVPVLMTPPKQSNATLVYDEDTVSPEEKQALALFGIVVA